MAKSDEIRIARRKRMNSIFYGLFLSSTLVGVLALVMLMYQILSQGLGWLDWQFLTDNSSRRPERSGIYTALIGTFWLMAITAPLTFIIGVASAIYLEEDKSLGAIAGAASDLKVICSYEEIS